MKRHWDEQELAEHWWLTHDEFELVQNRTTRSRLGFAVLLKFFQVEGRFPFERKEVPTRVLDYLSSQLDVSREAFIEYPLSGRSSERDRAQIRSLLGFRRVTVEDAHALTDWLRGAVLPVDPQPEHLGEAALDWCRRNQIEPPSSARLERILRSSLNGYEKAFFAASYAKIPDPCRGAMDRLLRTPDRQEEDTGVGVTPLAELRADPGRPSLESVLGIFAQRLEKVH